MTNQLCGNHPCYKTLEWQVTTMGLIPVGVISTGARSARVPSRPVQKWMRTFASRLPLLGLQCMPLSAAQAQCSRVPAQLVVWPPGTEVTASATRSGVRRLPQMPVRMVQLPVLPPMLMVLMLPVRMSARSLPRLPMAPRPAV